MQRTEFFVIFDCFLLFYSPNNPKIENFEKMIKLPRDIIILHTCNINNNHMMYGSWDMEQVTSRIFCHFRPFFAFYPSHPPTPYQLKKWKFWKNEKNTWRYHHFKCVPKIMIRWCMVPEIWCMTDRQMDGWMDGWTDGESDM